MGAGQTIRRSVAVYVAAIAFLLLVLVSPAAAADCAPDTGGTASNITRSIVPIGFPTLRAIQISADGATNVQLSVPAGYTAVPARVSGSGRFGFLISAPQAGPFTATATWTQSFVDTFGYTQTCTASAVVELHGSAGEPLKLTPPKKYKWPKSLHVGHLPPQYPILNWTYKCATETDATPLTARISYQVKRRGKLTHGAPSFELQGFDPCDPLEAVAAKKSLPHRFGLKATVGGDWGSGVGLLLVEMTKSITHSYIKVGGKDACLHIGVVIKHGAKTIVNAKYDNSGVGDWRKGGKKRGPLCI
ncbi:MAG: hypothetical protein ACRDKI_01055 [Solirubrobacterales bacterium]